MQSRHDGERERDRLAEEQETKDREAKAAPKAAAGELRWVYAPGQVVLQVSDGSVWADVPYVHLLSLDQTAGEGET